MNCTWNIRLPAAAWKLRDTQWCLQEAERIGPACYALVHALFNDAVMKRLRAVQGILRLAHKHGAVRLEAAGFDALAATYTEGGRFCRDTSTMLQ